MATNFNARVSGDVFFIWDIKNVKYAVVHYIDELTDYRVGALEFDPTSDWAAETLCRLWYDVCGHLTCCSQMVAVSSMARWPD